MNGLEQDGCISSTLTLEILQPCDKRSIYGIKSGHFRAHGFPISDELCTETDTSFCCLKKPGYPAQWDWLVISYGQSRLIYGLSRMIYIWQCIGCIHYRPQWVVILFRSQNIWTTWKTNSASLRRQVCANCKLTMSYPSSLLITHNVHPIAYPQASYGGKLWSAFCEFIAKPIFYFILNGLYE